MGKWDSSRKKYILVKSVFIISFFVCLISVCVFAENWTKKTEYSEVKAARRAIDVELEEAAPVLLAMTDEQEPEVEATKEIVDDTILSNVPAADYAYSFDKTLDNVKVVTRPDDYGGYNEGTYPEENTEKSPLFTEGIEGAAVYLDGSYGIELCDIAPLDGSYTISFWFRAEEIYDWSSFLLIGSHLLDVDTRQNYICFNKKTFEGGEEVVPIFNTINAEYGNSCEVRPSLEDKNCIKLNEWNYITIRVDGTQVSEEDPTKVMGYLYLNSEMIGCSEVSKMTFDGGDMKAYLGINCFDKMIRACYDEVRIWNSLLDENQITNMYMTYVAEDNEE